MPEYLAPGVYVEEVGSRAKSIEGVPTSTAGFAGLSRYGPVQYEEGPSTTKPRLVTSYLELERAYGGSAPLQLASGERVTYLAHAARAFFDNGGKRLYVSRVFAPPEGLEVKNCCARLSLATTLGTAAWIARWPGEDGNVWVDTRVVRSNNLAFHYPRDPDDILRRDLWGVQVKTACAGAVVEFTAGSSTSRTGNDPLVIGALYVVEVDDRGKQTFIDSTDNPAALPDDAQLSLVEMRVMVHGPSERIDIYEQLGAHPKQRRYIGNVLERDDPRTRM